MSQTPLSNQELNKQQIANRKRIFREEWTEKFLFVKASNVAVCLVCKREIRRFNTRNIKLHYTKNHASQFEEYVGESRIDKISELKRSLTLQQGNNSLTEKDMTVHASYVIAHKIARSSNPYSEAEFVKLCIEKMLGILYPKRSNVFANMDVSYSVISSRVKDISNYLEDNLRNMIANFVYYSLAINNYNDEYLGIYIRGVDVDFNVTEEMLSLVILREMATSMDLYVAVQVVLSRFSLDLARLSRIKGDNEEMVKMIEREAVIAGSLLDCQESRPNQVQFTLSLFSNYKPWFTKMRATLNKFVYHISDEDIEHASRIALKSEDVDMDAFFSSRFFHNN